MGFVRSPSFTRWVEEAIHAALAARSGAKDGDLTKLEAAVRAQEARVEKVASTLLAVGTSEFLVAKLRQEEERLRDTRQGVAAAVASKRTARVTPKITIEQAMAVLTDVERIGRKAPRQARDVLASVIEPVVLTPTATGYEAEIRLKSRTAYLAAGRPVFDVVGCGGRI